jgi:hypothetical protein
MILGMIAVHANVDVMGGMIHDLLNQSKNAP